MCIYIYIYIHTFIYIYIYIERERKRERERERDTDTQVLERLLQLQFGSLLPGPVVSPPLQLVRGQGTPLLQRPGVHQMLLLQKGLVARASGEPPPQLVRGQGTPLLQRPGLPQMKLLVHQVEVLPNRRPTHQSQSLNNAWVHKLWNTLVSSAVFVMCGCGGIPC